MNFASSTRLMANITRSGVFAIHKPRGPSSAQVLRNLQESFSPSTFFSPTIEAERARRLDESRSKQKHRGPNKRELKLKMGHGGTLDPLASGVLIVGVGSGTKALAAFLGCTKEYETVVVFGASTDTYDRVGRILDRKPYKHITRQAVEAAVRDHFTGKIKQMPPLYSALKHQGKPLYEYAREGKPIPENVLRTRDVEVLEIELLEWMEPGEHNHRWPAEKAEDAVPQEEAEAMEAYESLKRGFEKAQDQLVTDGPSHKKRKVGGTSNDNHNNHNNHNNHKSSRSGNNTAHSGRKHVEPLMSGALGSLPADASAAPTPTPEKLPPQMFTNSHKGSDLVPDVDTTTTPPWDDEGPPAARIRMKVTSGFYVRSFCHDLGDKVGSAGLMAELCRSEQGDFAVGGPLCLEYDMIGEEKVWAPKMAAILAWWADKTYDNGVPVLSEVAYKAMAAASGEQDALGSDGAAATKEDRDEGSETAKAVHEAEATITLPGSEDGSKAVLEADPAAG